MNEDRPNQDLETVHRIEAARLENPPEAVADLIAELSGVIGQIGTFTAPSHRHHLG